MQSVTRLAAIYLFLSMFSCPGPSEEVVLPAGTEIKIRLEEDLATAPTSVHAEKFTATLAAPLSAHGTLLARAGAPVWGEWTEVDGGSDRLIMTLRELEVNG